MSNFHATALSLHPAIIWPRPSGLLALNAHLYEQWRAAKEPEVAAAFAFLQSGKAEEAIARFRAAGSEAAGGRRGRGGRRSDSGDGSNAPYAVFGNVGVIMLTGPLQKDEDIWTDYGYATSYRAFVQAYQASAGDPNVATTIAYIDSPGGYVDGAFEAAAAIGEIRKASRKPIIGYGSGMVASAAYLQASQMDGLIIDPTTDTGSIGVRASTVDLSEALANLGIKINEFQAGAFKGAGSPYHEMTDPERAYIQAGVEESMDMFVGAVSKGRDMTTDAVRATEARLYPGKSAVKAGLADDVATSFNSFLSLVQTSGGEMATTMRRSRKDKKGN